MEQVLEKLFESVPRVRLLRLFMRNPEAEFTFPDIVKRSQLRSRALRVELKKLLKIGLIKKKRAILRYEIVRKSRSRKKPPKIIIKTKRTQVFLTNQDFPFLKELQDLIIRATAASRKKLIRQIKGLGKIKLAVLSGIFINSDNSRTDLLIVGDGIKKSLMEKFLEQVESELGRSLQYTVMDTAEFKYRLDMYDRFLRDILEYPHDKLINKLHV
ncbi:MAG: hypothetical protein HYW89_01795 [Candidatus Sungiibacteriota bacterium]|uniref:HTH arsR-type domain-containing protein n=1 Tax=Candidatus Sungiibacteriota bacterium TaxID=2750080 RepID=A0A7T5USF6_9BACT|nr:MAG: hypothetical protein HYW89_01795 [Candidatus Sungbacteria bacterium]